MLNAILPIEAWAGRMFWYCSNGAEVMQSTGNLLLFSHIDGTTAHGLQFLHVCYPACVSPFSYWVSMNGAGHMLVRSDITTSGYRAKHISSLLSTTLGMQSLGLWDCKVVSVLSAFVLMKPSLQKKQIADTMYSSLGKE